MKTATRPARTAACQHCTDGKIPGFAHVQGGTCFRCNGTGEAPVESAERHFAKGDALVTVRYEAAAGRHVVQVRGGQAVVSERFARVEDARSYWSAAREALLAEGYSPYVPF